MTIFATERIGENVTAPGEPERHIADILIRERCEKLAAHPLWRVARPVLYSLLGYRKAVRFADAIAPLGGVEAVDYISDLLKLNIEVVEAERIPRSGGFILTPNHPTGIADGIAVWDMLTPLRDDIAIFTNRDAVRVNPRLDEVLIPVEWTEEKKTRAKTRETLRMTARAFNEGMAVVLFASGRLAYWNQEQHRLAERPWQPTVFSMARKYNVPIIPLHIGSRNSGLFYLFSRFSTELRDVTLFHELLNKRETNWRLTVGRPIDANSLDGDPNDLALALQNHVEFELPNDPTSSFDGLARKPEPVRIPAQ